MVESHDSDEQDKMNVVQNDDKDAENVEQSKNESKSENQEQMSGEGTEEGENITLPENHADKNITKSENQDQMSMEVKESLGRGTEGGENVTLPENKAEKHNIKSEYQDKISVEAKESLVGGTEGSDHLNLAENHAEINNYKSENQEQMSREANTSLEKGTERGENITVSNNAAVVEQNEHDEMVLDGETKVTDPLCETENIEDVKDHVQDAAKVTQDEIRRIDVGQNIGYDTEIYTSENQDIESQGPGPERDGNGSTVHNMILDERRPALKLGFLHLCLTACLRDAVIATYLFISIGVLLNISDAGSDIALAFLLHSRGFRNEVKYHYNERLLCGF